MGTTTLGLMILGTSFSSKMNISSAKEAKKRQECQVGLRKFKFHTKFVKRCNNQANIGLQRKMERIDEAES